LVFAGYISIGQKHLGYGDVTDRAVAYPAAENGIFTSIGARGRKLSTRIEVTDLGLELISKSITHA